MATFTNSVDNMHREVMECISYSGGFQLPASPPDTPPMKQDARMTLRERTSLHKSLGQMLPQTPPQSPRMNSPRMSSPRMNLKRTFSNNVKGLGFPLSPPNTPPMPSRMGIHSSLARTVSDSYFSIKSRPSIVTTDVTELPRHTPSRSSSYSLASANSASSTPKDPLDRVKDYSTRSTDSVFLSPELLTAPAYSPPPNTPATFSPTYHNYTNATFNDTFTHFGSSDNKEVPSNPPAYTGQGTHTQNTNTDSQYGTQNSQSYSQPSNYFGFQGAQYTSTPGPPSIADMEKARSYREPDRPQKKRDCACKTLICCIIFIPILLLIITVVVLATIIKMQNQRLEIGKRGCIELPGMYVHGEWQSGYRKCT